VKVKLSRVGRKIGVIGGPGGGPDRFCAVSDLATCLTLTPATTFFLPPRVPGLIGGFRPAGGALPPPPSGWRGLRTSLTPQMMTPDLMHKCRFCPATIVGCAVWAACLADPPRFPGLSLTAVTLKQGLPIASSPFELGYPTSAVSWQTGVLHSQFLPTCQSELGTQSSLRPVPHHRFLAGVDGGNGRQYHARSEATT